jgi:hypothetical protein
MDACLWAPGFPRPKKFDAFNGAILWEVKTYNFDNQTEFFKSRQIPEDISEASKEREMAQACSYIYWYTIGDARHAQLLEELSPSFVPNVAQNLEVDPANCLQP